MVSKMLHETSRGFVKDIPNPSIVYEAMNSFIQFILNLFKFPKPKKVSKFHDETLLEFRVLCTELSEVSFVSYETVDSFVEHLKVP